MLPDFVLVGGGGDVFFRTQCTVHKSPNSNTSVCYKKSHNKPRKIFSFQDVADSIFVDLLSSLLWRLSLVVTLSVASTKLLDVEPG